MLKKKTFLFFFFLFLGLFPYLTQADCSNSNSGDIIIQSLVVEGYVQDKENSIPLSDVELTFAPVYLSPDNNIPPFLINPQIVFTNKDGFYFFLQPAPFPQGLNITFKKEGYKTTTTYLSLPEETCLQINQDFYLEKDQKTTPLIIVPGIMASYLYDINKKEEVWPRLKRMLLPGKDSYLYDLALSKQGLPSNNHIQPTDIFRKISTHDIFEGLIKTLQDNGYQEGKNLFVFPYDWRLDIDLTSGAVSPTSTLKVANLKDKIDRVKAITNSDKVDVIAHSMGGLLVKRYLQAFGSSSVDKFIDIATPHLGAPKAFKVLMFGDDMGFDLLGFSMNDSTVQQISQNFPAVYELLPSFIYFQKSNKDYQSYIVDVADYDANNIKYILDYKQSQEFFKNTGRNELLIDRAEQFHNTLDNYSLSVPTLNIVGCGQPTIGYIYLRKKDKNGWQYNLRYINGDGTVPLKTAQLSDISNVYINSTTHAYLPSNKALQDLIVHYLKGQDLSSFSFSKYPFLQKGYDQSFCYFSGTQVEFHSPITLHIYDQEGHHVGPLSDERIEMDIPGVEYDILGDNKFAFLPKGKTYRIVGQAEQQGTFTTHLYQIENNQYIKKISFFDLPLYSSSTQASLAISASYDLEKARISLDFDGDGTSDKEYSAPIVLNASQLEDITSPTTTLVLKGIQDKDKQYYFGKVKVSLSAQDNKDGSGIFKTEYSLDKGKTWQIYKEPFILKIPFNSTTTKMVYDLRYFSQDKAGNKETEKQTQIKIKKRCSISQIITLIEELFQNKDITKKQIKNSLIRDLKSIEKAQKKYRLFWKKKKHYFAHKLKLHQNQEKAQKLFFKTKRHFNKVHKKIIDLRIKWFLKKLEFYYRRHWISKEGYRAIKQQIYCFKEF